MNEYEQMYRPTPVAALDADARGSFITKTYLHLFGAIGVFTLMEVFLFQTGFAEAFTRLLAALPMSWLLVLGGFMGASWLATRVAFTSRSQGAQYAALGGFIFAEAIIFAPLLWMANQMAEGLIGSAAGITMIGFGILTGIVFYTRKDFSFLRTVLIWGGFAALGFIVVAVLFGLPVGAWFCVAMIALAGGAILYDTSNILHHYPEDRYVGAALQLFASVALMFWYVVSLLMRR
jgi:FtsH-binding integral membrane protein